MSGDNNSESRSRVILAWVGTLLVIGIAGAGYLFSTPLQDRLWQTVVFFTAICAGLVLVWRSHSLRFYERKHTEVVVCAQRDLARIISTVSSSQAAWPLCFEIALRVSKLDCGGIYLFDEERRVIELVYHQGLSAAFVELASRYTADSPNAQRISDGKSLYISDDEIQQVAHLRNEGVHTMVVIPIHYQGCILGSLNIGSHRQRQIPEFARHALETIAAEMGNIIVYLRTEEALRRSTQILSESQTIAHLASWSADCQTGAFTASAGSSDLVTWITGVHTVEDLAAIIYPDDREHVQSSWIAALHGVPLNTDYRVVVNDEVRWIHVTAKITLDEQQKPTSIIGVLQDITDHKQAEIALRRSEEKYRGLMESLDSAIHSVDPDGRFLYINEVAARLFERTPEEIIGKTFYDVFPHDSATRQLERLRQVIHHNRSVVSEWRGAIFGEPRWYPTSMQPIHDEVGRVISVLVNSTDIHDLKTAQQELLDLNHTLEERVVQRSAEFQDLYDNAPNGYHSLDKDGMLSMVNQTELTWLGYSRDEMIGRPFTDFITEQSRATFQEHYAQFKQSGRMRGLEYECIRKDGTTFHIQIDATAIYDSQGTYVTSRSTMIDNTEHKKAEETLQRANSELARAARTKDEFLANMSHELRTPLNAILGMSEGLREEIRGPLNPRQQDALKLIESSGRHLLMLINDILDLSKVEAGRMDLFTEIMSVSEICQSSLMFVRDLALKKSLTLTFQMNDHLAMMEVDPKRLKQMLVNLLSNAVKFTPDKGAVSLNVNTDTTASLIRFMVRDTGIGISPDNIARLFQPFIQLDSSLSRQYEGTGLGLALVRRLANLHGGNVTVESEVGQGSCFTITLPYAGMRDEIYVKPVNA
jgi:PAS domain S-box-containing protein